MTESETREIVSRLRQHEISPYHGGCADCFGTVMDEAADEIERLLEELRVVRSQLEAQERAGNHK